MSDVAAYARPAVPARPKRWKRILKWSGITLGIALFTTYQVLVWTPSDPLKWAQGISFREKHYSPCNSHASNCGSGHVAWVYDSDALPTETISRFQKIIKERGLVLDYESEDSVSFENESGEGLIILPGRGQTTEMRGSKIPNSSTVIWFWPMPYSDLNDIRIAVMRTFNSHDP